ncbi:hypothetical protein PUN28_016528 [Cardiocondyla obscurior]|uniref:Uncharacterized protein n=1 Tax=Cardiocondyla obscurior TaxID=286306 RepID=A0AAW2ERR3_9HYME
MITAADGFCITKKKKNLYSRARQTSCRWPTLRLEPPSLMWASRPISFNSTSSRARHNGSSLPENRNGSCGIMLILERRSCKPIWPESIPSISIKPSTSAKRKSAWIRDDLPAPVLPTIPTFSRGKITKLRFLSTGGSNGA